MESSFKRAINDALDEYENTKNPQLDPDTPSSGCCSSSFGDFTYKNNIPLHRQRDIEVIRDFVSTTEYDAVLRKKLVEYIKPGSMYTGVKILIFTFREGKGLLPTLLKKVLARPEFRREQLVLNALFDGENKVPSNLRTLTGIQLERAKVSVLTEHIKKLELEVRQLRNEKDDMLTIIKEFVQSSADGDDDYTKFEEYLQDEYADDGNDTDSTYLP